MVWCDDFQLKIGRFENVWLQNDLETFLHHSPTLEVRGWSVSQRSGAASLPLFDAEAIASTEWQSEEPFEDPDGLCPLPDSFSSLEALHWAR